MPKFHHCRIYVVDFKEGGPKKPILNRVKGKGSEYVSYTMHIARSLYKLITAY